MPPPAAAQPLPSRAVSLDLTVLGGAFTYARLLDSGRYRGLAFGLGSGVDAWRALSGGHFDPSPVPGSDDDLFEIVHLAWFWRGGSAGWLEWEAGPRAALFIHGGGNVRGGGFLGGYGRLMVGTRRVRAGPLLSAGVWSEGSGTTEVGLQVTPLWVRLAYGW